MQDLSSIVEGCSASHVEFIISQFQFYFNLSPVDVDEVQAEFVDL